MKYILHVLIALSPFFAFAQSASLHPPEVQKVLNLAGKNKAELEKAIVFFKKQKDPQKLKAINFLVANMDIHVSANYFWADSAGKPVPFNELNYPDLETSVTAFAQIKDKTKGIHPVAFLARDIDSIKSGFLIENVEHAFKAWKNGPYKEMSFDGFCEYLLPYRVSVEPLQDWRETYKNKFSWLNDSAKTTNVEKAIVYLASDLKTWFANTHGKETRPEPLPRLGAQQILLRQKGACEDMVDLTVFAMRSQGFPATANFIPEWATSTGRHFVNGVFNIKMEGLKLDILSPPLNSDLIREPAKVLVSTYAKQPDVLARYETENNIPDGFMRTLNYKDVTEHYWATGDIKTKVRLLKVPKKHAYLCVFNGLKWKPVWWGKVEQGSATFHKMSKGAVYLPVWYIDGKIVPAAYPIASGYNNETVLAPDTLKKRKIIIEEQDKYLVFQPGKKYTLQYWNNGWKKLGTKIIPENANTLEFENVPENALLLMIPEYTQGKERPFMITGDGKRVWW